MRVSRKVIFLVVIAIHVLVLYLSYNWHYLPYFYQGYGPDYNQTRIKIGQPVIEEYFVEKKKGAIRRQTWVTPDSIRDTRIHLSKYFNTRKGELVYEFDFYALKHDSFRSLLKREYFFENDSVVYEYKVEVGGEAVALEIEKNEGDSILNCWIKLYPTNKYDNALMQ
ncbi:hypothetical protein BFP72_08130 [Reichenbachiella sp. 5M10]|uniref:hypothetical protein n=1 Tax=Reichenbachiella sp. 5M10 TaxID=1889772 RepID=UPI000C1493F4|nr:hypothetical protein [Reichenbachiella sp. 5M10]PIB35364.1 hypothetical protein BFP72_08130 [Reichenbachiella sp. 5M10]